MEPLPAQPSLILQVGFIVLSILLVAMFAIALRSRWVFGIGIVWLVFTGIIGSSGLLSVFDSTPPRILLLLFPTFAATIVLGLSKWGKHLSLLPLSLLVGYQAFRIPVEILIHLAAEEGVAPPQMSWDGINLDVLSGASALLLFPFVKQIPKWGILLWNTLALCLLIWIVGVAVLSFPSAFQRLKPNNIWVTYFPFVWLPTIAVPAALIGHIAVYRKLLSRKDQQTENKH
ncbi:hypothetical protein [Gimesia aquarii]|uniref:Uncharacterized protein n=1 Tax=Gimesia aquarii TaxID=2527964 RepID=A0A517VRF2_9PLAN|nr:hypothetical protein [Gimesia aquarii]QDT95577.1 hypothetical protein V144x_10220 [Gimesia aquarii]